MTVKELLEKLNKVHDKNAKIIFGFCDYFNPENAFYDDIPTIDLDFDCMQDDSYYKDPDDKIVWIDFKSSELIIKEEEE